VRHGCATLRSHGRFVLEIIVSCHVRRETGGGARSRIASA